MYTQLSNSSKGGFRACQIPSCSRVRPKTKCLLACQPFSVCISLYFPISTSCQLWRYLLLVLGKVTQILDHSQASSKVSLNSVWLVPVNKLVTGLSICFTSSSVCETYLITSTFLSCAVCQSNLCQQEARYFFYVTCLLYLPDVHCLLMELTLSSFLLYVHQVCPWQLVLVRLFYTCAV